MPPQSTILSFLLWLCWVFLSLIYNTKTSVCLFLIWLKHLLPLSNHRSLAELKRIYNLHQCPYIIQPLYDCFLLLMRREILSFDRWIASWNNPQWKCWSIHNRYQKLLNWNNECVHLLIEISFSITASKQILFFNIILTAFLKLVNKFDIIQWIIFVFATRFKMHIVNQFHKRVFSNWTLHQNWTINC